jgi:hypothetical protein
MNCKALCLGVAATCAFVFGGHGTVSANEPETRCIPAGPADVAPPFPQLPPDVTTIAEVRGGVASFPKVDEGDNRCVPSTIARAALSLNRTAGQACTQPDASSLEADVFAAVEATGLWQNGSTAGDVGDFKRAKERFLTAKGITDITTEVIPPPLTLDEPFFRRLADALKDGAAVEVHYERNGQRHLANVARVVSHEGNFGIQTIDDPNQGSGGSESNTRAPDFWKPDGTSYGISQKPPHDRILGRTLLGFLIERKVGLDKKEPNKVEARKIDWGECGCAALLTAADLEELCGAAATFHPRRPELEVGTMVCVRGGNFVVGHGRSFSFQVTRFNAILHASVPELKKQNDTLIRAVWVRDDRYIVRLSAHTHAHILTGKYVPAGDAHLLTRKYAHAAAEHACTLDALEALAKRALERLR